MPIVSRHPTISSGFTLLELMISLTIMGLILVLVFGALRIGARAWEKGERDVETHQRQRFVLDNLKRQIASVFLREIKAGEEEEGETKGKVFFRGDSESMEFMSRVPMSPLTRTGVVYVKYVVREDDGGDTRRLLLYEKDGVFVNLKEDLDDIEDDQFFELITGAASIEFSYLYGFEDEDEELQWQDKWDNDSEKDIPVAIKIALQEDADAAPIYVIVRLQVEGDEKGG